MTQIRFLGLERQVAREIRLLRHQSDDGEYKTGLWWKQSQSNRIDLGEIECDGDHQPQEFARPSIHNRVQGGQES